MSRYDHILEIRKSRFDTIVEKRGNPYHDPKTGRFTSAPGGGSFSPAGTVDEARAYAKDKLGFSGRVDYSYSYIDQQNGRQVFGTLDMETVNHINKTITDIQDRYPELKGAVKDLVCTQSRVYAEVNFNGRDASASLRIGARAYENGLQAAYDRYAEDVAIGFHPKGTDGEAILWHEYGHVYAAAANKASCGQYATPRNTLQAIGNTVAESGWKDQAAGKMMADGKLKQEYDMLGLDFSPQAVAASYGKRISKYATKDDGELFAEAFAAHNTGHGTKWTQAIMDAAGADRRK